MQFCHCEPCNVYFPVINGIYNCPNCSKVSPVCFENDVSESAYLTGTVITRLNPTRRLFVNGVEYAVPTELWAQEYFDVCPGEDVYVNGVKLEPVNQ